MINVNTRGQMVRVIIINYQLSMMTNLVITGGWGWGWGMVIFMLIINHHQSSSIIINHHKSSINNHQSSININHHQSSMMFNLVTRGGDVKSCLPWKVEHRPGKGRVLVASRSSSSSSSSLSSSLSSLSSLSSMMTHHQERMTMMRR